MFIEVFCQFNPHVADMPGLIIIACQILHPIGVTNDESESVGILSQPDSLFGSSEDLLQCLTGRIGGNINGEAGLVLTCSRRGGIPVRVIHAACDQIRGVYGVLAGIGAVSGYPVQTDTGLICSCEQLLQGICRFLAHQLLIIIIGEGEAHIRDHKVIRNIILAQCVIPVHQQGNGICIQIDGSGRLRNSSRCRDIGP